MATITVYLARHGVTEWIKEGRYQGHSDIGLDAQGRRQAEALGERLSQTELECIYASDLPRALETAEIVRGERELELVTDQRFREIDLGELSGMYREDVKEQFADTLAAWKEDPLPVRLGGGETLGELQERVWAGLEDVLAKHPEGGQILIVAHGYAIITLLAKALDLPLKNFRRLWQDPTGLSELSVRGDSIIVKRINDIGHLDYHHEVDDDLVYAGALENLSDAHFISTALDEEGISYRVVPKISSGFDLAFPQGWGMLYADATRLDEVEEIILQVRADEAELARQASDDDDEITDDAGGEEEDTDPLELA